MESFLKSKGLKSSHPLERKANRPHRVWPGHCVPASMLLKRLAIHSQARGDSDARSPFCTPSKAARIFGRFGNALGDMCPSDGLQCVRLLQMYMFTKASLEALEKELLRALGNIASMYGGTCSNGRLVDTFRLCFEKLMPILAFHLNTQQGRNLVTFESSAHL